MWLLFLCMSFELLTSQSGNFGSRVKWINVLSAGGPEDDMSDNEFQKHGRNRQAEGKTSFVQKRDKSTPSGDDDIVSDIFRKELLLEDLG